ncbi:MAG: DUF6152 family protein [Steroidobacteraceae bacterium]
MGTLLAVTSASQAHHSREMFDVTKNLTYQGVVKEYRWQNPHSHLIVVTGANVTDPTGVKTLDIEVSSLEIMVGMGWKRTTFKKGDQITVVVHPHRSSANEAVLFYAVKADGARLYRATHRYPGEAE